MKKKIVSIILCTYNCAATLKNTLDSIKKQDYSCIEVVIKDGGSNDGTLEIINDFFKEFQGTERIVRWKSEFDKGIYDAMNQGFLMSTGDVIVFFSSNININRKFLNSFTISLKILNSDGYFLAT